MSFSSEYIVSLTSIFKTKIREINLTLTREQWTAQQDDSAYQKIKRMLFDEGDLTRAKELIQATNETYWTTTQKNELIAIIDTYNA